jgi:hypothetical protein
MTAYGGKAEVHRHLVAEDAAGYIVIRPKIEPPKSVTASIAAEDVEINPHDIPF